MKKKTYKFPPNVMRKADNRKSMECLIKRKKKNKYTYIEKQRADTNITPEQRTYTESKVQREREKKSQIKMILPERTWCKVVRATR